MATVTLDRLNKRYSAGAELAVDDVSLAIAHGEFFVLLGPSGCGKSTTLRMIAGLESISAGELAIDGKRVNDVPSKDRDIAMVFQSYALYPHMSVFDNLAFGLRRRGVDKAEIGRRVNDVAATLGLAEYLARKPHALSGGQRQRVALGRAIVRDPKVFLFDEPLSNLDAALRVGTRGELVRLHKKLGATMIYVTHDQVEAMTMGDRICIMNRGRVVQTGAPLEVYSQPADTFVASFLGSPPANLLAARIDGESIVLGETRLPLAGALSAAARSAPSREVIVGIRPEDICFDGTDAQVQADVLAVEQLGAETILRLQLPGVADEVLMRAGRQVDARAGTRVALSFDLAATHLFDPASTRRIATD
ncbi:MAG: sn-glycerol-3-phosphate ABC transporter ATP-binding protein UgpC [Burkholderiaceae bacterium]|nr:sn-glycerol-3-phosphate ABC transporter ATP-binding protein UgpC [Burkholderiaceae bacterium]